MGFPLSTDIFGQLKWLVKQVKLLVFRVTRIEQGGGGGAQNINQVLTTGDTATNKTQTFIVPTGIIGIGKDAVNSVLPGDGIQFQNTTNNTTTSISDFLAVTNIDGLSNLRYSIYGYNQIAFYDSRENGYFPFSIGQTNGYDNAYGFTITNGIGDSVSCNSTQYVITNVTTNGTKTNIINASSITATSTAAGAFPVILHFDANTTQMYSQFNNAEIGLNLSPLARTYTIGEERLSGDSYFGINSIDNKLVAGVSLLQTRGAHNNPAGFVEIYINYQSYWIEIWNDTP